MIKTIAFDMGGVVFSQSYDQAVARFRELGLADPTEYIDPFHQSGIFGSIEDGTGTTDEFIAVMNKAIGRELGFDDYVWAIQGYCLEQPQRNMDAILKVREMGYRTVLLSNTNPFMMHWADSEAFDGKGHGISWYFDELYTSYTCGCMKPGNEIFEQVARREGLKPEEILFIDDSKANVAAAAALGYQVMCPEGNTDWTGELFERLEADRQK